MSDRVLMKGNEALAEAAIAAGCRHFFGYPITPQTEVAAYMSRRMPKVGGTYLQAESELAAINMVLGAASAGVRAMTSSSSPGISLKTEGISYLCGSDLPALIINVQRAGPGLGGIQPGQADYWQATRAPGHGDLHVLVFAPCSVQEMVDTVGQAFDLADKYRMPAMLLIDGILGQMMEPVSFAGRETDPKSLPVKEWATSGHRNRRVHNIINSLFLQAEDLEKIVLARFERYALIEENEQQAEEYMTDDAEYVLVAYGATARIAKSVVRAARAEGIKAGMIRPITLWPFPKKSVAKAVKNAKAFMSVEMSMGQMVEDVSLCVNGARPVKFYGRTGGVVPEAGDILDQIRTLQKEVG